MLNLIDIHFKHANQGQMELAKKCVGDERCVARGRRLLWNISPIYPKLGRVRHWFALMFLLARAWVECRGVRGGRGRLLEHKQMFKAHPLRWWWNVATVSLYIPLSVSWHRDKGRAEVATLLVLHMGCYAISRSRMGNLTYFCTKLAPLHCNVSLKKKTL